MSSVLKKCLVCQKEFLPRERNDRKPQRFCSIQCWGKFREIESRKRVDRWKQLYLEEGISSQRIAEQEGVHASLILRFLREAGVETRTPGSYKRKAITYKSGYKVIEVEDHPRTFDGRKIYEHIIIAERILKRYLNKGEYVHHIDLDKRNNSEDNLVVLIAKEHVKVHKQLNEIVSQLIKEGIIIYDRDTKTYKRTR